MLYKVSQCGRCVLANTMFRTYPLCWDDRGMGAAIPCMHAIIYRYSNQRLCLSDQGLTYVGS